MGRCQKHYLTTLTIYPLAGRTANGPKAGVQLSCHELRMATRTSPTMRIDAVVGRSVGVFYTNGTCREGFVTTCW